MTDQSFSSARKRTGWHVYAAGAAVCAALTAGAYLFGIQPALARRDAVAADRAALDDRQAAARGMAEDLAASRRQLAEAARAVADLPLRLDPPAAVNSRLARLADLAGAVGLGIDEMQPGAAAADGPHYQTVPIRIAGTGTYPTCAAFLHQLRVQFPDTAVRAFECANAATAKDRRGAAGAAFQIELAWFTAPAKK